MLKAVNSTGLLAAFLLINNMNYNKVIDTILTGGFSIGAIELVSQLKDLQEMYALFVQSLIATAAIGRLTYDIVYRKKSDK